MTEILTIKSKKHFLTVLFLFASFVLTHAGEIELNGIYKGENLYVENPYSSSGVGFCVSEILVNDFTTTDEINSSFFEIDLSIYDFKYGDLIKITIKYKDGCVPRIVNKEVILPESTFSVVSMSLNEDAYLQWTTINEHGSLPFIIEQFRWNKWIKIGSVNGKGTSKKNNYYFKVEYHSVKNKFRIKQNGGNSKPRYSHTVEYVNNVSEITFIPGNAGKVSDKIFFSAATRFEIYDYYGKIVQTGTAHDINVKDLKPGTYFLNYDNKTETFFKK